MIKRNKSLEHRHLWFGKVKNLIAEKYKWKNIWLDNERFDLVYSFRPTSNMFVVFLLCTFKSNLASHF